MTKLGTIERAYADGYAAARVEIERLTVALQCAKEALQEGGPDSAAKAVEMARRALERMK